VNRSFGLALLFAVGTKMLAAAKRKVTVIVLWRPAALF